MPATLNRYLKFALIAPFIALLLTVQPRTATAQTATVPATTPTTPAQPPKIPLSHLYMHFFLYEAHLEHLAEEHPIKNVNGAPIKEHLRKKIGFSVTEWQNISASSLRMETAILTQRTQTHSLILADRQACKSSPATCPSTPPNLQRVRELEKQSQQAIVAEANSLESLLGPDSTQKLRTYLQKDLATQVKVVTVTAAQVQAARQAGKAVAK